MGIKKMEAQDNNSNPVIIIAVVLVIVVLASVGLYFAFAKKTSAPTIDNKAIEKLQSVVDDLKKANTNTTDKLQSAIDNLKNAVGPVPEAYLLKLKEGNNTYKNKTEAENACKAYNATLATKEQVTDAFNNGADWCATGWVKNSDTPIYPVQVSRDGCSLNAPTIVGSKPTDWYPKDANGNTIGNATCYGVKPKPADVKAGDTILPFYYAGSGPKIYFQTQNR